MKQIKVIPILLGALLLLGSCVKEELPGGGNTPDGKPTLMTLSLSASLMDDQSVTRAGLPKEEENKFKDVRVMIFQPNGEVVTNYKIEYPTATANPEIKINTYSGSGRSVYIIANVVDAIDARLRRVTTVDELNAIQLTASELQNGLSGKPLIMVGKLLNLDIRPNSNVLENPIRMEYMSVKLTLKVVDATPADHSVTILGWDIENGPQNSFLILDGGGSTPKDANYGKEGEDAAWLTTKDAMMSFDKVEATDGKATAYLTQYLFENRRGGRVNKTLPPSSNRYPGMDWKDSDHRGKAWFAPQRATCIVIHAMHKTPAESKVVEARIFLGADNSRNYDIDRGTDYQFTVTVKGLNDIDIDTNIKPVNGSFAVHTSAPLDWIDAHPDFRPVMISGVSGTASIEILDAQGRSHNEPGFDAKWVKVSPLNLMYHQVRQSAPNDEWQQQAGTVGSFVRAKYIPHKSVRAVLSGKGGWNTIPVGKEDDDIMTITDATYRMCYKITDIPFDPGVVINKTLCVYTDEFLNEGGTRSAQIKIVFQSNGTKPDGSLKAAEERILTITQNGYLTAFDATNPDAGLAVFNKNGTPSNVKKMFVIEQYEEVGMMMNPGIDRSVQMKNTMQWGFNDATAPSNSYRNGYLMTAQVVYKDVIDIDNRPTGFGKGTDSYMDMYGNHSPQVGSGVIPNYTKLTYAPYYYPVATDEIYHPIFKSSASRYCHEKNRDINGDGCIDESETKWYLPSFDEMNVIISLSDIKFDSYNTYHCSTRHSAHNTYVFDIEAETFMVKPTYTEHVRCVREF